MSAPAVDAELRSWSEIEEHSWSGLLLGNGASIAVWDRFKYSSLFATSLELEDATLGLRDRALFEAFDTENFELVLSALKTAQTVCSLMGLEHSEIDARYSSIRRALIEAVNEVHVPWGAVSDDVLRALKTELLRYDFVYSTNYDLLVYWSVMLDGPTGFKDYFWSERFDVTNTEVWDKVTKVLYLHGGIHLYRLPSGATLKRRANGGNLLELFAQDDESESLPLFIAEGSSADKLRAIYGSDYLSFALAQFSDHRGDVVIFGQGLGDSDEHLAKIMSSWAPRTIAVSLVSHDADEIIEKKVGLMRKLKAHGLVFFDAATHPLGSAALKVPEA